MESRVTAYTIDGVPCILDNVSRHEGDLAMPSKFQVGDILNQEWWRMATKEERAQHGKWYHVLRFMPVAVIHSNGELARLEDTVGLYGQHITVLAEKIPVPLAKRFHVQTSTISRHPRLRLPLGTIDNMRCFENALFAVAKVGLETVNHLVGAKSTELQSV